MKRETIFEHEIFGVTKDNIQEKIKPCIDELVEVILINECEKARIKVTNV